MTVARTSLGVLYFPDHTLAHMEKAVRYSFEARRGKLYHALRALNAMLVVDLARQATGEKFTRRDLEKLAWKSLEAKMEKELSDQFRFAYVVGMARRRFGDLDGVMRTLGVLVPQLTAEYEQRQAAGTLARKGGFLRWSTGTQEVGSIEDLVQFCGASLRLAEHVLDEDSAFTHLTPRVLALTDMLPS